MNINVLMYTYNSACLYIASRNVQVLLITTLTLAGLTMNITYFSDARAKKMTQ